MRERCQSRANVIDRDTQAERAQLFDTWLGGAQSRMIMFSVISRIKT